MESIKEVYIEGLWGTKKVHWYNINPDVNILVGINGSGKSSLLSLIHGLLGIHADIIKKYNLSTFIIEGYDGERFELIGEDSIGFTTESNSEEISFPGTTFINTFDVISSKEDKDVSPLMRELLDVIYTTGEFKRTFFDYRLKATNFPEQAGAINERIQSLYALINRYFAATRKRIEVDVKTNRLVFRRGEEVIQLEDLSAGEKQFLLIIFKVFLMEEEPAVLLMDEPEISLHVDWQHELINVIRELNPNCQLILATHSPSIFGDGWGDKIVYMEDILKL